ncbi:virulence factor, BrkB family protein [Campylobacter pinnipediorum subsp. pinnipediorum]|uniref:YihY family inner membrane protein n=1 Tax=Campylobacter pinnipediorum TaxID=1965231 RepID=UPI0009C31620|nr:YihY family inner membrane protein [Campylobacter pinnipediorum]AQW81080.1 virulence factor, BrkB family protein [Campylobacter pinnipediorum subsp. pinnipediorum]
MKKLKDIIHNIKFAFGIITKIKDKELMHYASSLSFHTVLSIIPVLLLSFSLFTQLPVFKTYYSKIESFIFSAMLPTHQDVIGSYLQTFLKNSVNLGIVGFVAVIFTSAMFFMDYEYVVNKIMSSKRRSFWSSISSYWTLITLAPLGLALSFYLSNLFQELLNSTQYTSWINFISIFPYLIIWCIFCVVYLISVSSPLKVKNALLGSFISSLAWYLGKSAFIYYALNNKTYLSIYGSFSIMLFFFLWIYISWIIFLYGFKICSLLENKSR